MALLWHLIVCLFIIEKVNSEDRRDITPAFDLDLYKRVLDSEQCELQLTFLARSNVGVQFVDASAKLPSGILTGNLHDLGDYHQCLRIERAEEGMEIYGKYCILSIPLQQNIRIPELPLLPKINKTYRKLQQQALALAGLGGSGYNKMQRDLTVTNQIVLGICIPRVCNTSQAIDFVLERVGFLNLSYTQLYCRLPNDKPFAVADLIAVIVFSVLAILIIASTSYDLCCVFILQRAISEISTLNRSFSLYTNTRRFLTFTSSPGALECVDGIRAISMMWVIVGHTYSMTLFGYVHNLVDVGEWLGKFSSTWLNSAPIVVDTFFMLSGVLAVYTTLGKVSRVTFVKGLHLFYLHRLLRMFPLLAAVILLQASVFHHASDGPNWRQMALFTEYCRKYWLNTLLHVQNYVNPDGMCLPHSWYLSVDVQLYLLCPLVVVWLFGRRRFAWIALTTGLCLSLISSSYYSFTYNFAASLSNLSPSNILFYMRVYYYNTLCRAPPFFVGMLYGYILHLYRGSTISLSKISVSLLWVLSFALMSFCIFSIYPVTQVDHSAQLFDNILNAYMRAIWALGLGWLILACVHGYGGPINWFLSLQIWKLPSRLSYAMYLIHFPIMVTATSSWTESYYFTDGNNMYRFMGDMSLSFLAAFILCVTIDAPFSTLQKLLLGGISCRKLQSKSTELPGNSAKDVSRSKPTLKC